MSVVFRLMPMVFCLSTFAELDTFRAIQPIDVRVENDEGVLILERELPVGSLIRFDRNSPISPREFLNSDNEVKTSLFGWYENVQVSLPTEDGVAAFVTTPFFISTSHQKDLLADDYDGDAKSSTSASEMSARWGQKMWSQTVVDSIANNGEILLRTTPRDIDTWCPQYRGFSKANKQKFWVYLFSSLSHFESGHRGEVEFEESFSGPCGDNVISRGVLQLSAASSGAVQYHSKGCLTSNGGRFTCSDFQDLHDPMVNLTCGVAIMSHWLQRDKRIQGSGNKGGARYWAPFRDSSRRNTMKRWTKRFCARL